MTEEEKENAIRAVVSGCIEAYASGFSGRHLGEVDNPDGVINMKIHNVFIAALGPDIQYYSALSRSLDSSLGNTLEKMAVNIAKLNYSVKQVVVGGISGEQISFIAKILEEYNSHKRKPTISDYEKLFELGESASLTPKTHDSDYYLYDRENDIHHLIELKIGGDLDNKKARSEKEALLEQYCILVNSLRGTTPPARVELHFATAYNRYGEGKPWRQSRVLQFFAEDELLISSSFWNMICKTEHGYDIVIDEYKKNAHHIVEALERVKKAYLKN